MPEEKHRALAARVALSLSVLVQYSYSQSPAIVLGNELLRLQKCKIYMTIIDGHVRAGEIKELCLMDKINKCTQFDPLY